jgi:Holliday junction resolvasome RuvABC DNA-binding subunit
VEEKLNQLEKKVNQLKIDKARYDEKLNMCRQQRETIVSTLAELGIDPKNLQTHIKTLEDDIALNLSNIEKQLPEIK